MERSRVSFVSKMEQTHVAKDGLYSSGLSVTDCSLVVLDGPHKGAELRLEQELVRIGRAEWCDLILSEDNWVSNIHCECWLEPTGVRLRDLRSRNGVMLDGSLIVEAYLREDAIFKVGNSTIQLKSHHRNREISLQFQDESGSLVGKSPQMRKIFSMLSRLGQRNVSTLLTGETGTGKTSIAQAIHEQSGNPGAPFVVANCGALPASLIESVLFGYEKGAFTGAASRRQGLFQQAHGGTLFLDEIAEMPLELQPKLLDVLERRKVRRLGSEVEHDVDFRLIAATHRHLPTEIREGRFREDLFFRISVVELEVPPLRERPEDISLLAEKFMTVLSPEKPISFDETAIRALQRYLWPGNTRQLRNVLERALIFLEGSLIRARDLELPSMQALSPEAHHTPAPSSQAPTAGQPEHPLLSMLPSYPLLQEKDPIVLKELLVDIEKELIEQALRETGRSVKDVSKLLGISLAWLYNRIRKHNLSTRHKDRDGAPIFPEDG